jgi:hypothetical protein
MQSLIVKIVGALLCATYVRGMCERGYERCGLHTLQVLKV